MASLPLFKVEQWMDAYETRCTYNLAETCCDSISLDDLHRISLDAGITEDLFQQLRGKRLTYGHIRGSPELRSNIAKLYPRAPEGFGVDDVLVTQGAIGANFLAQLSLCKAGDHVICVHPTYQSLFEVPRSLGAEVDLCRLRPEEGGWTFPLDDFRSLLRPNTSLVVLNNPNNPTGQALPSSTLHAIVEAVKQRAAPRCIILCDEVYRPLFHTLPSSTTTSDEDPCSILETGYDHVIATGSLSKSFSLAGIRVGWIATPRRDLIDLFASRRDYNVISVSMVDDTIAARALHPHVVRRILERNLELARTNRAILSRWIEGEERVSWIPTQAGTTALLRIHPPPSSSSSTSSPGKGGTTSSGGREEELVDTEEWCKRLLQHEGVLLAPGACFDWPGWVRIGYVGGTEELKRGLDRLTRFLREEETGTHT